MCSPRFIIIIRRKIICFYVKHNGPKRAHNHDNALLYVRPNLLMKISKVKIKGQKVTELFVA